MRYQALVLVALAVIPLCHSTWAITDLGALGSPEIAISPASGPPGTKVTITVSKIPDISNVEYPYPDLYVFLPFSQPFGLTVPSHCGGEDCFPIYTHNDALNHDSADRTVTFSLFGTANPPPVYLNGFENSVCDVDVNGKIMERYSTLCNAKNEPEGTYTIKFAWVLESDFAQRYVVKSVNFTVTPASALPKPQAADNGNSIIDKYQKGQISESEFYSELKALGWSNDQIRQALGVIGKLPHQMGTPFPDKTLSVEQATQAAQSTNASVAVKQVQSPPPAQIVPESPNDNHTVVKTKPADQVKTGDTTTQDNLSWNNITIVSSVGAAAAIGGGIFIIKRTRKVTN